MKPAYSSASFLIVIAISMFREGWEDYRRHEEDSKENAHKNYRYNFKTQQYDRVESQFLEVGDVIRIPKNGIIPADCLLWYCSNISKISYVMTANWDGEKNLKPRFCQPELYRVFNQAQTHFRMTGKVKFSLPDPDWTKFSGNLFLTSTKNPIKLDVKHIIYKGTMLANTKFAIVMVLYTGRETKIVMNSQKCPPKCSHLEATVNIWIIVLLCIQITFCILLAILNGVFYGKTVDKFDYLKLRDYLKSGSLSGFVNFWTFLLLLNTMIPISLIVSIEVAKYLQAIYISWDIDMFSQLKERFASCNTCSINEEWGQIKYIFSDKTGTLTANKLEFTACAIGKEMFGMTEEELENKDGKTLSKRKAKLMQTPHELEDKAIPIIYTFPDKELKEYSTGTKWGEDLQIVIPSASGKTNIVLETTQNVISMFWYCLSLNHTCFVEKTAKDGCAVEEPKLVRTNTRRSWESGNTLSQGQALMNKWDSVMSLNLVDNYEKYNIHYSGENPDEIILVDTAKRLGYVYWGGDETLSNLRIIKDKSGWFMGDRNEKWNILKSIKFTSARGKMSVIVKKDNNILLFCKGGNSKIQTVLHRNQPFYDNVNKRTIQLSEMGWRVLWIAMKVLDDEEFYEWKRRYDEIPNDNEKAQDIWINQLELGLTLIGCTAVEDNWQDKVPETIYDLQTAGINIWVLTGDNLPTAKNITISCKWLPTGMELYEIYEDLEKFKAFVCNLCQNKSIFTPENIQNAIKRIELFEFQHADVYKQKDLKTGAEVSFDVMSKTMDRKGILLIGLENLLNFYHESEKNNPGTLRGILVEAAMLTIVLPPQECSELKYYTHPLTQCFLEITWNSQAVVCCRVSPMQKALVVRMIKANIEGAITLAIGDGANDVSMIQEADVGVGIFGEEGTQAAMASDYAIGEFRCLRKLILSHGRLNYIRIAEMILYFFFKNFLFTLPQFFYAFYSGYSGQSFYDDWFISLFNLIFTAWPWLVKAILDQDVNEDDGEFVNKHIAYIYYIGREGLIFNYYEFAINIIQAIVFSVMAFFFNQYMMFYTTPLNDTGQVSDHWVTSNTQFTAVIFLVNYRLWATTRYHTWINWIILIITSYGAYTLYFCVSSWFSFSKSMNVIRVIFTYPQFYWIVFLTIHIVFVFDIAVNFIHINWMENPVNMLRKYVNGILRERKKEEEWHKEIVDFDVTMRGRYKIQRRTVAYMTAH